MTENKGLIPGYETTFVTRTELPDEGLSALKDRLNQIFSSFNGEVILSEDWGKRKLAYPVKKETRGQYTYIVYTGKEGVVSEVERNLRIHEHTLRFLTVSLGKEFDPSVFKKQRADAQAAAKRREEEREARREERGYDRRGMDDDRRPDLEDVDLSSGVRDSE